MGDDAGLPLIRPRARPRPPSVSALRAAYGGCAPTRACGRSPKGEGFLFYKLFIYFTLTKRCPGGGLFGGGSGGQAVCLQGAGSGDGFFQIQMPDGTTAYTRDGSFQLDAQGRMVTSSGLPVANGITVPPNAIKVSISADGIVSATLPGNPAPQQLGNIAMSSFVNPAGLEPVGQNMYKESAASGQPQQGQPGTNGLGFIKQGFLEASNVNVVEELVTMIQTQRAYEMNSKAISTSDQMLAKLSQL